MVWVRLTTPSQEVLPLLLAILASLPGGKPQRDYLEALLALLVGLPVRPTYRNLARFGDRCPHTHGCQAARAYDFAALNLAGLCAVVPYAHDLAWAGDSTCLSKSGRKLPGAATAGTAARGGWPGASNWSSCQSWIWRSPAPIPCTRACNPPRGPAPAGPRAGCPGRRGPRWRSCRVCWTRPGPWTTAPTSGSSWGTATTAVRP